MKVAFDSQIFIEQQYGGISRYVCELASHLDRLPETRARIFAPLHRNGYLPDVAPRVRGAALKLPFVRNTTRLVKAVAHILSGPGLARYAPDVMHRTYYDPQHDRRGSALKVLTVYDMIHERFQAMFPNEPHLSAIKRHAVAQSDHIICISRQTQADLIEMFDVQPEKTSVVYLGFESPRANTVDRRAGLRLTEGRPYLLYVGSRGGYKNFARLLQAYGASSSLKRSHVLVCFGGGSLSPAEREMAKSAGLEPGRLLQFGGDDRRLAELYAAASLFAYPSLYEGFGIPPLEAMSFDCPVVCGNSGSIPEVVADAAVQCDTNDVEALKHALERVLGDESLAQDLRQRGRMRCAAFSWQRCASETLASYRSML